jgi:hypothetical protein
VDAQLKKQWDRFPAETMFVAAIRAYALGQKDQAVYWFYSGEYRSRLVQSLLSAQADPSTMAACGAFQALAGGYINGYAFGDLQKVKATIETVRAEGEKTVPALDLIYRDVRDVKFMPQSIWAEKNKEIAAGMAQFEDYITQHADEIKAARRKNGIEGKY